MQGKGRCQALEQPPSSCRNQVSLASAEGPGGVFPITPAGEARAASFDVPAAGAGARHWPPDSTLDSTLSGHIAESEMRSGESGMAGDGQPGAARARRRTAGAHCAPWQWGGPSSAKPLGPAPASAPLGGWSARSARPAPIHTLPLAAGSDHLPPRAAARALPSSTSGLRGAVWPGMLVCRTWSRAGVAWTGLGSIAHMRHRQTCNSPCAQPSLGIDGALQDVHAAAGAWH